MPYAESEMQKKRAAAAESFRPDLVSLLLIAEAPPADLNRYFYFPDVSTQDSLFRYVFKGLFNVIPSRSGKKKALAELKQNGVFLIDLKLDPIDGSTLAMCVPDLLRRVQMIAPTNIILIKATVFDAAFYTLQAARLPVLDARIPFPGSGQQVNFERKFAQALNEVGWNRQALTNDITPP